MHVPAERLLGWDAAGRSVRLRKIPLVHKVRHDIANSSRTQPVNARARHGPRSNRLPSLDIGLDNQVQNLEVPRRHTQEDALCTDYKGLRPLDSNHYTASGEPSAAHMLKSMYR